MKKYFALLLLISFALPSCVRKKTNAAKQATPVELKDEKSSQKTNKPGAYDEELGAYVLDEDADKDVFETPAPEAKKGEEKTVEPVAPVKVEQVKQDLPDDSWAWQEMDENSSAEVIHFDFDSSHIRKDQEPAVKYDAQLAKLASDDGATVVVEGHSCMITRSNQYNQALSQRRAQSAKDALVKNGVPEKSIKAVGRGTSHCITRAPGKEEQAPNRRAEVKFIYPK